MIFYEDTAQLEKIMAHVEVDSSCPLIEYRGLKIVSFTKESRRHTNHLWARLCWGLKNSNCIYSEFANFLPRLISTVSGLPLICAIFGWLPSHYFEKPRRTNIKLWNSQFADEYWIFGKHNKTHKTAALLRTFATVRSFERKDLSPLNGDKKNNATVFIGQAWEKERLAYYADLERQVLELLSAQSGPVVYCVHPRGSDPGIDAHILHGYAEMIEWLHRHGLPKFIFTLSSSLGDELREMGIEVNTLLPDDYLGRRAEVELFGEVLP